MQVAHAMPANLEEIRAAYADGRARQVEQRAPLWPEFANGSILAEIESGCLLRVLDGTSLVGVFSVAYEDAAIWGEHERRAHIYLHRIARASAYHGRGLVDAVLEWALAHCEALGREGLRMGTWASNGPLIAYYETLGFTLLGKRRIEADSPLPPHYRGVELALLERPLTPV